MEANERSAAASQMAKAHPMLEALTKGTAAMREAGKTFLPKWPNEEEDAWTARLNTSTLFPAYRRTVSVMAGKPFSKAVTLDKDVPDQIEEWAEDIDREGVNLHTFCAEMFAEGFYGLAGILVESPKAPPPGLRPLTVEEQRGLGIRPYFVRVMHDQVLGWRFSREAGARRLVQLRISENTTIPDGDFGEKKVERVRILEPGTFRVLEKQTKDAGKAEWAEIDAGTTGLAYIPFVPIYGRRCGLMHGEPPLIDLAYLNVKHWQSQSDQDNILHVARVPILFLSGGDEKTSLTVGGSAAVQAPEGADLKWVEHSGNAIGAGENSLKALEEQMIQAGAELLVKKPGDRSATEAANDAEANKSDLQRMVEDFEDSIDAALQMMADYASLPSGGHVSLFKDFGAATLQSASAQLILSMNQSGLLSDETTISEMKRRGELSAEVDYATERDRIADQGPALGTVEGGAA
jgi:hypothetical protein